MSICRLLVFCSVAFAGCHHLHRQAAKTAHHMHAAPSATQPVRAPTPSPSDSPITYGLLHVRGPYVAMTFDDGPDPALTPKLLDILAAEHVKATFFVVGEKVAAHPEIVSRAAQEGHEIGNHSWSHPNLTKLSDDGVREELRRTETAIASAIGTRPSLMRPPYGALTTRQKSWIHHEFGYPIILWNVGVVDWKHPQPEAISNRIISRTHAGSIVLCHDLYPATIIAMPQTLDRLRAEGFKFVTVSQLIRIAAAEPEQILPRARPHMTAKISPAHSRSPAATASPSPPLRGRKMG